MAHHVLRQAAQREGLLLVHYRVVLAVASITAVLVLPEIYTQGDSFVCHTKIQSFYVKQIGKNTLLR